MKFAFMSVYVISGNIATVVIVTIVAIEAKFMILSEHCNYLFDCNYYEQTHNKDS